MTASFDVIDKSVTKDDIVPGLRYIGLWNMIQPNTLVKLLPELPIGFSPLVDRVLASTPKFEPFWAGALNLTISKLASMNWDVSGDVPLRVKRAQDMFHTANGGKGFINFLKKHLRAYLCCDNGAHIEIVRATQGAGSKIVGFVHLDPHRCRRTGDPDIPIIYIDRVGGEHELRSYQVFSIADMPDESDTYFDAGFCAAHRAYETIRLMAVIQRYIYEKISGARPLSIEFLTGITTKQLQDALSSNEAQRISKAGYAYGGVVMIPFIDSEKVAKETVQIQGLPDGFDRDKELANGLLSYANSIGIPFQTLKPLSGQGLGSGKQSEVLQDAAKGQGVVVWMEEFEFFTNYALLGETTTFTWNEKKDLNADKIRAEIFKLEAEASATLVEKVGLAPDKAINQMVDKELLPPEFIVNDQTAGVDLADDEKFTPTELAEVDAEAALELPAPSTPTLSLTDVLKHKGAARIVRRKKLARDLVVREQERAKKLYEELVA
jgi:hypothetical protein